MLAGRRIQLSLVALALLITVSSVTGTATNVLEDAPEVVNATAEDNYNCPVDCQCVLSHSTYLHAKCSSIANLKSAESVEPQYPIHSIDLSHLRLSRLWHIVEKLPNLTTINLSHNELHDFGHLGRRIKKLNLKHNRITSNKLSKLPQNLNTLNLQFNDITYLTLDFKKLTHLANLELSNNDINCSCETLEVRNWLQEKQVFMENPVICSYPIEVRGKSWLQVKQSDICEHEKNGWYLNDEENELMFGDQPIEGSGEDDAATELTETFLPVTVNASAYPPIHNSFSDVEGSGDLSTTPLNDNEDENVEGSGSGGGPILQHTLIIDSDDFEPRINAEKKDHDDTFDTKPVEPPITTSTLSSDLFGSGMGIFHGQNVDVTTDSPVQESSIAAVVHQDLDSVPETNGVKDIVTDGPSESSSETSGAVMHANTSPKEESKGTYLLLGVILLIVCGLLLFVGIKRCNKPSNGYDAEAARQTELLDMDKKNLGKPLQRNGNEHAPLIGEKTKVDLAKPVNGASKKTYDENDEKDGAGQQLLNGNGTTALDSKTKPETALPTAPITAENPTHEYCPITPRYPTPKSPRASKYAQYPPSGEHNNNTTVSDAYLPSSPKSGRYSPVYSPETGRVKIKLTETPKPKTPMLVTRSKSNAGDIITTPVRAANFEPTAVGANGRVQH